jgi:pyruvate/2-oxoglutarate dehydrogenase complex dihydrolipoamide acyltransferase (E2) component
VSGVPAGWHDDGTTLTAPNGVPVVHGFRDWVMAHEWNPADVPIAPEMGVDEVEMGNPSLGAGTIIFFLMSGQYTWTQARGVFATYNGQEIRALRQQLATAQAAQAQAEQAAKDAQAAQQAAEQQAASAQAQAAQAQAAQSSAQPAPLTAAQQSDLAAMAALRAALG